MTPESEMHLQGVLMNTGASIDTKYRAGYAEHFQPGDPNLFEKPVIMEVRNEAIDLVVYTDVLLQQRDRMRFSGLLGMLQPNADELRSDGKLKLLTIRL